MDPLVSLMMVEKVPDSTYEMVGGLDKQVRTPHLAFFHCFLILLTEAKFKLVYGKITIVYHSTKKFLLRLFLTIEWL